MATAKLAIAADAVGVALGVATAVTRRVPGAQTLSTVLGLVDTQPKLRGLVGRLVGTSATDALLTVGTAVTNGMTGSIAGGVTDMALRLAQRSSERAQRTLRGADQSDQSDQTGHADHADQTDQADQADREGPAFQEPLPDQRPQPDQTPEEPPEQRQRPRPLPPGPIERYVPISGAAGTAAALASRIFGAGSSEPGRRGAGGSGSPAIAVLQASLPRAALAGRDMFVARLGTLLARRGVAVDDSRELAVLDRVDTIVVDPSFRDASPQTGDDALTTALARTSAAVVEPAETANLREVVRNLQAEGRTVLLIARDRSALAAADCAVRLKHGPSAPDTSAPDTSAPGTPDPVPPAGGTRGLHASADLAGVATVVDAVDVAAKASRQSVRLAEAGAVIGAVAAYNAKAGTAVGSARFAVTVATATAAAQAAVLVADLARQPSTGTSSAGHQWHKSPAEEVMGLLATGPDGLTSAQAQGRASRSDRGTGAPQQGPGLIGAFIEELRNPLTPVLAAGAAMSAAIGSVADAAIVLATGGLGAALGTVQRRVTDRSLADLLAASAVVASVCRDGQRVRLPADQLVPGDVIAIGPGDVVPADARLFHAFALELDESSLTGESLPVPKQTGPVDAEALADRSCMVYQGTTVAAGRGQAVVVATGDQTVAMAAADSVQAPRRSGVTDRLAEITGTTVPVAIGSVAAVLLSGLVRRRPLRETIGGAVGLAVASVPEGLPFLVNAAQLAAARRLSAQGALVRNIATVEALGRVDVLCFDKTGTLTKGIIQLAAVSDGTTTVRLDDELPFWHRTVLAAGLRATPAGREGRQLAHSTDRAVAAGAERLGIGRDLGVPGWVPIDVLPFEPSRGFHAVAADTESGRLLTIKGAPEILLPRCGYRADAAGKRQLRQRDRRRLRDEVRRLAKAGYRVLAVTESNREIEPDAEDLTFVGLLAFADPVRVTAGASIEELSSAGAQIVVITGDHPDTAERIADELGIANGHTVVTGPRIDELDDAELAELVPKISVVARSTPAHKVRVVRAFQQAGRVVAMTGDGANDAPAIRLADVGIAMGHRGTPAAAAAADLVVTDDRLETIIAALVEGRAMWRSVRQGLSVLVGGNLGEIGFTVFGAALTGTSPLSARQLLLVNLLTDLAPAMVLAVQRPDIDRSQLLTEGPESSLGQALNRDIAARATTTALGATAGWLVARATGSRRRAATVALIALVGTQLAQTALLGRSSPAVLVAAAGSAMLLAAAVQIPGLSGFFGCTPIGPIGWTIAIVAAVGATLGSALAAATRGLPTTAVG